MKKLQLRLLFFVSIVSIFLVSLEVDGRKSLLQKQGVDESNKLVEQNTISDADFHGEMVGNNQKKKLPTDLEDIPVDEKGENSEGENGSEEDVPGDDDEGESEEAGDSQGESGSAEGDSGSSDQGDSGSSDQGDSGSPEGEDGDLEDYCGGESGSPGGEFVLPKDCGEEFGDDDGGSVEGGDGEAPGGESGEEVSKDNNGEDSKEKVPGDN